MAVPFSICSHFASIKFTTAFRCKQLRSVCFFFFSHLPDIVDNSLRIYSLFCFVLFVRLHFLHPHTQFLVCIGILYSQCSLMYFGIHRNYYLYLGVRLFTMWTLLYSKCKYLKIKLNESKREQSKLWQNSNIMNFNHFCCTRQIKKRTRHNGR